MNNKKALYVSNFIGLVILLSTYVGFYYVFHKKLSFSMAGTLMLIIPLIVFTLPICVIAFYSNFVRIKYALPFPRLNEIFNRLSSYTFGWYIMIFIEFCLIGPLAVYSIIFLDSGKLVIGVIFLMSSVILSISFSYSIYKLFKPIRENGF